MPADHPNVDALIKSPASFAAMPAYHPAVGPWLQWLPQPAYTPFRASVKYWHPDVEDSYRNKTAAPASHPLVHALFTGALRTACRCACAVANELPLSRAQT